MMMTGKWRRHKKAARGGEDDGCKRAIGEGIIGVDKRSAEVCGRLKEEVADDWR